MDQLILYKLAKALHIIFITTWMAGLFYLPRLFVYHSRVSVNSQQYKTFEIMEMKLLKYIMNPSFFFSWFFGIILIVINGQFFSFWFLTKVFLVLLISIFHMLCAKIRIDFKKKINKKNETFFRLINEVPTILFIIIIFLVVFKPMI